MGHPRTALQRDVLVEVHDDVRDEFQPDVQQHQHAPALLAQVAVHGERVPECCTVMLMNQAVSVCMSMQEAQIAQAQCK